MLRQRQLDTAPRRVQQQQRADDANDIGEHSGAHGYSSHTTVLPTTYTAMTLTMLLRENLSFLLTNRLPRRWLTLFMGWLSPIEHWLVRAPCMWLWQMFA